MNKDVIYVCQDCGMSFYVDAGESWNDVVFCPFCKSDDITLVSKQDEAFISQFIADWITPLRKYFEFTALMLYYLDQEDGEMAMLYRQKTKILASYYPIKWLAKKTQVLDYGEEVIKDYYKQITEIEM